MAIVRRSPRAEADLAAILDDLDQKDPAVADRDAAELEHKARALAQFPELGRRRPEIARDLRSTHVHPSEIFDRIAGNEVQIIRILHGRQDLRTIMRKDAE